MNSTEEVQIVRVSPRSAIKKGTREQCLLSFSFPLCHVTHYQLVLLGVKWARLKTSVGFIFVKHKKIFTCIFQFPSSNIILMSTKSYITSKHNNSEMNSHQLNDNISIAKTLSLSILFCEIQMRENHIGLRLVSTKVLWIKIQTQDFHLKSLRIHEMNSCLMETTLLSHENKPQHFTQCERSEICLPHLTHSQWSCGQPAMQCLRSSVWERKHVKHA